MQQNNVPTGDGDHEPSTEKPTSHDPQRKLRALFPRASDGELNDIAETLHGYCATVWRIYDRLKRERLDVIDELMQNRRMKAKVDSSKQKQ